MFAWLQVYSRPKAPLKTATVVVSDFNNHTGDAVFDGALEPMLRMALEGAGIHQRLQPQQHSGQTGHAGQVG